MHKARLEAFSDGVIAIIITIMVLEMKVPHGESFHDLIPMTPIFLSYIMSFLFVAVYWQNHHHLLQITEKVDGRALWANTHLLFWLSILPFATGWMGENHFASDTVVLYGIICLFCGFAYLILTNHLLSLHGKDSQLAKAIGKDIKGKISFAGFLLGTITAHWYPIIGFCLFIGVSMLWFLPDRRIEKVLSER